MEKALTYVRGSVEISYQKLSSYFHMSEKKSLGIITHLETDENGRFKYCFMALGVSLRGCRITHRPVLYVDGSFLKHKCGRYMLVAIV